MAIQEVSQKIHVVWRFGYDYWVRKRMVKGTTSCGHLSYEYTKSDVFKNYETLYSTTDYEANVYKYHIYILVHHCAQTSLPYSQWTETVFLTQRIENAFKRVCIRMPMKFQINLSTIVEK